MHDGSGGALTERLWLRVERDFPVHGSAAEVIRVVSEARERLRHWEIGRSATGIERLQAAMVLGAQCSVLRLRDLIALAEIDWRDLLVGAGLADENWPSHLDRGLGPSRPQG